MSVGSTGSQVPWIGMSSPGPAARVSPVRAITGHLTSERPLHPRCPGLPSLPHRLISPEPLPTPTRHPPVTRSRPQASPGRKIQHLSVYRQGRLLYSRFSQSLPSHQFLRVLVSWAIFSLPWWNLYSPFCLYLFHPHIPSPKDIRGGNAASQKVLSSLLRQCGWCDFFLFFSYVYWCY